MDAEKPKKKVWRDSRLNQLSSPTASFSQKRMFQTVEDITRQSTEKNSLGLGKGGKLFDGGNSMVSNMGEVPHLSDSLSEKKISEKSRLHSRQKEKTSKSLLFRPRK